MVEAARPIMISLVGEQPIPNLMAARHFCPAKVVLAFTEKVKSTADILRGLLKHEYEVHCLQVFEFDLQRTQSELARFITQQGWQWEHVVFNLTGGTKIMVLAAYRLASEWRCPFIYVESDQEPQGQVYRYEFSQQGDLTPLPPEPIRRGAITLEEYLKAHIGSFTKKDKFANDFEKAVFDGLTPAVDEIRHGIIPGRDPDIDIAFRVGNQAGVAQLKTAEKEINQEVFQQLSLHTHREVLGTYTKRFVIVSAPAGVHHNLRALAQALQVKLIELPSYSQTKDKKVSNEDRDRLIREVRGAFG